MFLRSQFFFYRVYFQLLDHLKCIIFTWNPSTEYFEMNKSLAVRSFSWSLVILHLIYMCGSSYILFIFNLNEMGVSTISIVFHLLVNTGNWYWCIFRVLYTHKAEDLVCIMNSLILLEKFHFKGKLIIIIQR